MCVGNIVSLCHSTVIVGAGFECHSTVIVGNIVSLHCDSW